MVNPLDPNFYDKRIYTSDEEHPLIAPNKPFTIKPPKKSDAVNNDKQKKKKDKNGNDIEDDIDNEDEDEPKPLPRPMGL